MSLTTNKDNYKKQIAAVIAYHDLDGGRGGSLGHTASVVGEKGEKARCGWEDSSGHEEYASVPDAIGLGDTSHHI